MYRFDSFQLDPRSHELRRDGLRVKIPEQCFVVLLALVERPGELVTREELRKAVWPSDTFVDFDTGLNKIIKQLRQILGDSAEVPVYIETAPKLGYRFVAMLRPPEERPTIPEKPERKRILARRWTKPVWLSALLLGIIPFAVGLLFWKRSLMPLAGSEVVRLTGMQGGQDHPAFSPDGSQVAFTVYGGEGQAGIYTTLIGGEKPLQLTSRNSKWEDCCPAWSPDGRSVAFSRRSGGQFAIYTVSPLGGTPRRIYTFKDYETEVAGDTRDVSWSPDGTTLAISTTKAPSTVRAIALLSLSDLSERFITTPPVPYSDWAPVFSPDGRYIAFRRTSGPGFVDDLYVMPSSGGEPRRLTFDNVYIANAPAWTPDSREIIFTSNRGGMTTLWRIPTAGGTPRRIEGIGTSAFAPSVAPKGHRLAYTSAFVNRNLWTVDLADPTHISGIPRLTVSSKGTNGLPSFSADGKRIAFESTRSGYNEIWTANRDGTNALQLTFLSGESGTPHWSYDDRAIAFDYRPKAHSEVYIVDFSGRPPQLLSTIPGADNFVPSWSRDGKWIYFASTRGGGSSQIWKIPYQNGTPIQLTSRGGTAPIEGPNGFIYYSPTMYSDEVWRISPQGGEEELVVKAPGLECWCNLTFAARGIYFIAERSSNAPTVRFHDFHSKKISPIVHVGSSASNPAVSPDGKSIVYSQTDASDQTIMVVNNFQ
jgi:Tol biopolymer transport system component/DNA-binding winged helix-turn-helix (wHTH) protein